MLSRTSSPSRALTPPVTLFAAIAGALAIGTACFYTFGLHGSFPFPRDIGDGLLGRDFLNTWFFGKAAFLSDPGRFYDHDLYMRWIGETVPQEAYDHLWSYPPSFMILAAPFGLLPYPMALAAWSLTGLLALYAAVRGERLQTLAILFSPAAFFCLIGGQISLLMAAFLIGALRLIDRRPIAAGSLIALCTIKPQIGLLIPILLIASRRWTVLAAATAGTLCLLLGSSLIWGVSIWRDYVSMGLPTQIADMTDTSEALTRWSPTITTAMLMAGLGAQAAAYMQLAFAGLAAVLVAIGCARGPMDARRMVLFLSCSVFAAPYFLAHDLVALSAAAVMLAAAGPLDQKGSLAVKVLFLLPLLQFAANLVHIPIVAFIPVGVAFWALSRRVPSAAADGPGTPVAVMQ